MPPTHCDVIQFLEPDDTDTLFTGADDHSLSIEEGGVVTLVVGQTIYPVTFVEQKLSDDYDFTESDLSNAVDAQPLALDYDFAARDKNGFTLVISGLPDTGNYRFRWRVRVVELTP